VAQIAAASYESGDTTSIAGLLTSNNPNTVLNGASLLLEISGTGNQKLNQFLVAARQLKDSLQQAQRTRDALTAIEQTARQKQQHAMPAHHVRAVGIAAARVHVVPDPW
jgi:hypothetical protein